MIEIAYIDDSVLDGESQLELLLCDGVNVTRFIAPPAPEEYDRYDGVVLDLVLADDRSGFDESAAIHARDPLKPIMILTGLRSGGGSWLSAIRKWAWWICYKHAPDETRTVYRYTMLRLCRALKERSR